MSLPYLILRKNLKRLWDSFSIEQEVKRYFLRKNTEVVPVIIIGERSPKKVFLYHLRKPNVDPFRLQFKIPEGKIRKIVSGYLQYVASGVVATRTLTLKILTNSFVISGFDGVPAGPQEWQIGNPWQVNLTAGQQRILHFIGGPTANLQVVSDYWIPPPYYFPEKYILPELLVSAGDINDLITWHMVFDELDYTGET